MSKKNVFFVHFIDVHFLENKYAINMPFTYLKKYSNNKNLKFRIVKNTKIMYVAFFVNIIFALCLHYNILFL